VNVLMEIWSPVWRLAVLALWIASGICVGTIIGYKVCLWWVVPAWVRQYPHDGQIGLGVMGYSIFGGLTGGIVSVALLAFWVLRRSISKRAIENLESEPHED
jgi:hypothetical protein